MPFDVQAARASGYSDDEIADHLGQQSGFDVVGAKRAGYGTNEILDHLSGSGVPAAQRDLPKDVTPSKAGAGRGNVTPERAPEPVQTFAKGKSGSLLEGITLDDPQLDPELNRQAMLKSGSPDSVMFTSGRGKQNADQMVERGAKLEELAARGKYGSVPDMIDAQADSDERKQFAKRNPNVAAVASGAANMLKGSINAPGALAGFVNKTMVDPVLGLAGAGQMPRVQNAPGTDELSSMASDYMPEVAKLPMEKAWDKGVFGEWLAANVSAQVPQLGGQILAVFNPVARAAILPVMGAQAAGGAYAEGDDPRVAVSKGVLEVLSEGASFGVADKIKDAILKMPQGAQNAVFANIAKRAMAAGGAVTGQMLAGAIEESAAKVGGNALDIYASGQSKPLMDKVPDSAVIGAFAEAGMGLPNAATALQDNSPRAQVARELAGTLNGGSFRSQPGSNPASTGPSAEEIAKSKGFLVREARIKTLRDAGETAAADLMQQKHDKATTVETVEGEIQRMPGNADYSQHYRNLRLNGTKPVEAAAHAAMTVTFKGLTQDSELSESAITAALDKAKDMPLDKVPGFLQKFTDGLVKRGLVQPFDGMGELGAQLESARDDAMDAAMEAVYQPIKQTMDAALELEQNQHQAPADNAQPATQSIANVQDQQAPGGTQAQAAPGPAVAGGPGSDAGNGFKHGPKEGERYRVGVSPATSGVTLEKRLPGGTAATFYVGKDGGLVDADDVNLVGTEDREKIWVPANKAAQDQAIAVLEEMGKLELSDPKRASLKKQLKQIVTGAQAQAAPNEAPKDAGVAAVAQAVPAAPGSAGVEAARGQTDIFSAPSEEQVSTKTSEKTGNTTKTYGGYVDGDGVPVELSIVRRADGTLFRVFAKYGDGIRSEFDAGYGPGITDEQIVKAVAEPSDWEKVAAKSLPGGALRTPVAPIEQKSYADLFDMARSQNDSERNAAGEEFYRREKRNKETWSDRPPEWDAPAVNYVGSRPMADRIIDAFHSGNIRLAQQLADKLPNPQDSWDYRTADSRAFGHNFEGDLELGKYLTVRGVPFRKWWNQTSGYPSTATKDSPSVKSFDATENETVIARLRKEQDFPNVQNNTPAANEPKAEAGPVGRNNVPLSEGGKPYKTKLGADTARKTQPMMRVQRVAGGYALIEKTPAQIAAQEKAAKRLSQPRTSPKGEPIPAHAMIAAEGGLHPDTRSDMGMQGNVQIGNRKLFAGAGRGLTIERATERLIEEGYLQEGASHDQARDLIKRSLTNPQYTPEGTERMAAAELAARQQAAQDEAEAIAEIEDASDNQIQEIDDADIPWDVVGSNTSTEAAMRALGFTEEEIQDAIANESRIPNQDSEDGSGLDEGPATQAQANMGGRESQTGEDSRSRSDTRRQETQIAPEQTPADAGVSVSAFETSPRPDGTLAVKGEVKAIREALKDIPAASMVPMNGGILVGRTQAAKAMAILQPSELQAPTRAEVVEQQDRAEQIAEQNFAEHLAQQQEAAQNEEFDDPFEPMLDGDFVADDFDVPGYDEASDPIKLEVNALLALADDAGINEDAREAIKEDAHYATLDQSEQAYYEAYRNALKAAIAASNRVGSADSGEASNAQGQREASPPEISGSVSAVQSSQKALEAGQAEIDEAKGLKYKLPYLEDRLKENLDPTDGFDMHILANELPPNRAYNRMMTDHNGDFSGVEFKNKDGRHAFVLPDASQPGKWRVSYFDKDGFSRHESEPTREKAQQSLARDGYTIEDRGALDRLASTKEWARGTDFAGLIFQLNSGAITHAQFIEKQNKLNADYEASKGEGLTAVDQHNKNSVNSDDFISVLNGESVGGNAGAGKAGVNVSFDDSGRIASIGNTQDLPAEIRARINSGELHEATFTVAVPDNKIVAVQFRGQSVPGDAKDQINKLVGVAYNPPTALTLTAPSRQDVLAQQAAIDAEAKRKEEGGDKPIPRKQLTGDIPDLFNPQGSVFDAPEEPTPAAEATAILDAANVTGKERIDALKDVKKGDITPDELQAAYPAKASEFSSIEKELQSKATKQESDGSIGVVMPGGDVQFVLLADAVKAAEQAIANGTKAVPFQIHNETGIRLGDTDRVIAAIGKPDNSVKPEAKEGSDKPASFSRGPWRSALRDGLSNINAKALSPEMWADGIKGLVNKGAAKADEVEWSGITDWLKLQTGRVTKEQVMAYLDGNGVQVQEVVNTDNTEALKDWPGNKPLPANTKYSQYQLPGGENYREVLLTLPAKITRDNKYEVRGSESAEFPFLLWNTETDKQMSRHRTEAEAQRYKEAGNNRTDHTAAFYKSSHWDTSNVLAHIRVNDRTDADGKRVLFVEEIQSDWGQDGKKKGFSEPEWWVELSNGDKEYYKNEQEANRIARENNTDAHPVTFKAGKVPVAPFIGKTDAWLNLALKRIITMAVEGGYDRVAFVNGEQSADRYDLSKQIGAINYEPIPDTDLFEIEATDLNGKQVLSEDEVTLARIEELVGKEIAKKIEAREGKVKGESGYRNWHRLSGLDLKVGGEGMRTFYDRIVPNTTNALLKKLGGGKMETVSGMVADKEGWHITDPSQTSSGKWMVKSSDYNSKGLQFNTEAEAKAALAEKQDSLTQPGFTLTPAMIEKASQGLPLFDKQGGQSKPTGLTPAQFTAELAKAFGAKVAERLQAKGVVVPLADQSKLPAHVVPFLRDGDIIYGFYDPKTDRTYAVLENLTPEMVKGLVLHEVGVHYGFEAMLGASKYANVLRRLEVLRKAGSKAVKAAHAEAVKNSVRASQVPEETLAYLVQSSPEMGIIKEIIARIKAFLFSEFGIGGKYLTEADLTMLARAAVDHSSRMEDGGSVVPAFMRGTNDAVTNTNDVVGNQGGRSADDNSPGKFAMAGDMVDGLLVRDEIPNQGSIGSSIDDYTVLRGIREIPLTAFTQLPKLKYYSISEEARTKRLAEQIKASGEINPLIVVIDKEGPYVLEGGHRFDALREIGKTSFPALVVLDNESLNEPTAPDSGGAAFSRTPGDQTQTDAFKRWFGDSAVVDADGKPLRVYHGTHSSFTEFKPNDALGGGMFFSPSPEEAGAFTGATGSNIMPVYLSAQKVWPKIVRSYDEVKAIRAAKSKGYDAIRVRDDQNGVVNWVVFDPTQVKSATGNSGAFDPASPDIRFSRTPGDQTQTEAAFSRGTKEAMTNNDVVGKKDGRSADDTAPGGTHPFNGFTREQFLGNPKITSDANAKDLVPSSWKSLESEKNVPFAIGSGLTARYSEFSAAVYNEKGDVVASYSFGDTLVVNKKYRRQGIGSELVYQWRMRNPNSKTAATRTKKSQLLQEKVWNRIRSERDDVSLAALTNQDVARKVLGMDDAPAMSRTAFSRPAFSRGAMTQANESVTRLANGIASHWENAPKVVVAFDMNDPIIPENVRKEDMRQRSGGATGTPEGFFYKGTVYLMSSKLGTPDDIARVMFHESLGHYGLRGLFGKALKPILREISMRRRAEVDAKIKQYGLKMGNKLDRFTAAEEVLAELAQTRPEIGIVQRAIAAIRTWLRKNVPGFKNMRLTDAEIIRSYILPARAYVENSGHRKYAIAMPLKNGEKATSVSPGFYVNGVRQKYDHEIDFNRSTTGVDDRIEPTFSRSIGDTLTSAANSARDVNLPAGYKVGDLFNSVPGKLNWWHRTVGTQYNLAQRSKPFKRVFDAVQTFINDVSYFATEAADLAPNILPKLESWKDIAKSPLSAADTKALSTPVFEGTLTWARDESGKPVKMSVLEDAAAKLTTEQKAQRLLRGDHLSQNVLKMWQGLPIDQFESLIEGKYESDMLKAGIVFTPAELKSLFSLNDKQVSLYQEFRKATDKSLTNLAIADMIRFGGKDVDPIREQVLESKTVGEAAEMLRDYLLSLADEDEVLTDTANKMIEKGDKAQDLMDRGYAPLSRFGTYTLDVVDADGERAYFGMFESAAEASKMRRKMEGLYPGADITQGTVSEEAYKMFAGVSPETLELFGDMLGLESQGDGAASQAFQEYLKLAKSSRSAMKRLIQRKGIAGFSEDAGRVLAGFVYSNARQTASSLHMGEMTNAANEIDKNQGELKDAAVKLVDYIKNPREEAQALRGLLFAQYIGGSVASAMVNMTQPFTMTFPWLSQFGGVASAAKQMTAAMKDSGKKLTGDAKLDASLKRAEEDGTVSPQEVHQLMQQSQGRGALQSGDGTVAGDALAKANNALSKVSLAWGKLFGVAEQFNRRVTFIAAYRTAISQGIANPDAFARKAIAETQGVYNKGNKPAWARGAVGSVLFTFKQYSIAYVEMLSRMAKNGPEGKKAALLALGVLFLMSGAGGMPGADDLDDVISGAMQSLGYNFDSKMKRKEFFVSILSEGGAQFMERGVSSLPGVPIDVSGRLSLGNLIPGTGLFTKKADHTRDVAEIAGPMGDFAKRGFEAAGKVLTGDIGGAHGAVATVAPKAAQNLYQAFDMYNRGMYRDAKGMKVLDTNGVDALVKAVGFQPNDVKRAQDANFEQTRMIGLNKINETDIANRWAMGIFEKDAAKIQEARDDLAEWNRANPESPIRINFTQIRSRVQKMNQTKSERIEKTAPKEIRAAVRQELAASR